MLRNAVLRQMPAACLARLRPHLFARQLKGGEVLIEQGARVDTVYFPTSTNLSNVVTFSTGATAETYIMGADGVAGLIAFLSGRPCAWSVEANGPGEVYGAPVEVVREILRDSPQLMQMFIGLLADYQAFSAWKAACSSVHLVRERLATMILLRCDSNQTDKLVMSQEQMAALLGYTRSTISPAAKQLKEAGALHYRRGRVVIADRAKLGREACECYRLAQNLRGRQVESGVAHA